MDPDFIEVDDETIIGSARWIEGDGAVQQRYHVLTIRDGKIADMQVCGSQRQALQFVRRAARRG